nr:hypothetical protein GCM10025730_36310 [Promicromonospora thailandica]
MTNISVHRLLDDAFAGIAVTPDVQDLKEEIRANLLDRVAELTAAGVAPDDAAQRAVDELGDVRALVTDATADGGTLAPATPTAAVSNAAAAAAGQRVPVQRRYMLGMIAAVVVLLLAVLPIVSVIALLAGRPTRCTSLRRQRSSWPVRRSAGSSGRRSSARPRRGTACPDAGRSHTARRRRCWSPGSSPGWRPAC